MKNVALISDDAMTVNEHLDVTKTKIEELEKSEESWELLGSTVIIYIILKEAFRYRKRYGSLTKSFTKACVRHSSQLSRIKI